MPGMTEPQPEPPVVDLVDLVDVNGDPLVDDALADALERLDVDQGSR